jgi:F-type H+-transporting ATPase subunit epsilon
MSIHLIILNLEQTIFEGNVESITLPGEGGELTILPNHLPLITPIKTGTITALANKGERYEDAEKKFFDSKGGIFEFADNEATVLL